MRHLREFARQHWFDVLIALLAIVAVALLAVLGVVWLVRARAARRWRAAINAYAERELARPRRGKLPRTAD